jgi:hypothetical protein
LKKNDFSAGKIILPDGKVIFPDEKVILPSAWETLRSKKVILPSDKITLRTDKVTQILERIKEKLNKLGPLGKIPEKKRGKVRARFSIYTLPVVNIPGSNGKCVQI